MDWNTYYHYPVTYKRWLIQRVVKEIEAARKANAAPDTKAPHSNTDEVRALAGLTRTAGSPSPRMQRFS